MFNKKILLAFSTAGVMFTLPASAQIPFGQQPGMAGVGTGNMMGGMAANALSGLCAAGGAAGGAGAGTGTGGAAGGAGAGACQAVQWWNLLGGNQIMQQMMQQIMQQVMGGGGSGGESGSGGGSSGSFNNIQDLIDQYNQENEDLTEANIVFQAGYLDAVRRKTIDPEYASDANYMEGYISGKGYMDGYEGVTKDPLYTASTVYADSYAAGVNDKATNTSTPSTGT